MVGAVANWVVVLEVGDPPIVRHNHPRALKYLVSTSVVALSQISDRVSVIQYVSCDFFQPHTD